jgi:hypothetical protein
MRKLSLITLPLVLCVLTSCGARDNKNEAESYPTYDTTEKAEEKNYTKNPEADNAQGDLRHNTEHEQPEHK